VGKNRSYQFSAHTYKRLGQEAAYVRQRGLQPFQAEQMALQYVKAYGKITRKQAEELCKISSTQARDLLCRLVKKGVLEMHDSKNGAYYAEASKNIDGSK
jgi:ATP-dependent DNA helicase RecG